MKSLYRRLSKVGLPRTYVKDTALPGWWEDSLADNPAGYAQCLVLLSRHLGLDFRVLQDADSLPRLKDFGVCKYKKRADTSEDELLLSRVIATRAAQLAAAAIVQPYVDLPRSALDLRQQILDRGSWVSFDELLNSCWEFGIPVLHVNHFPSTAKRPDGFTLRVGKRPVIVLCKGIRQPAWLLFILAHELGHIASGHIPEDSALIDEKMHDNFRDKEEEADRYALELLTGDSDARVATSGRWPNMNELALRAQEIGKRNSIDPGHIVLNYAYTMGGGAFFAVANGALKLLYPQADAIATVREKLAANLDWERLPEDSSDFLMRMTDQESDE